ncbi:MAG TPA: TetR/AcrR family transcriptional regulator [Ktedonobacteraceae bacterium]|nr:TetR/AcrR family transcriptional regulator [Ktedonobacteraceae bacterium]
MEESRNLSWPPGLPEVLPPTRSERRDAAEHRRRILEAAQHLFAQQGVDAVSMHQIAMAAGVGQGTLYRRYAHKGELCMDLLRERHERLIEEIAALFEATATGPVLERLDGVLACIVAFLEEQGGLLGPVATAEREWRCDEQEFPLQHPPFYLWLHELFSNLLAAAVRQGELAALDVPYTADTILAALHPLVYRFQRQERGYSPERILQGMHHIYIEGIKKSLIPADMAECKCKFTR